jgi:hypothetical protein
MQGLSLAKQVFYHLSYALSPLQIFVFCVLVGLGGFELRVCAFRTGPLCCGYFGDGVLRIQTSILLISVSQVARITSVNHRHVA